MESMNSDIEEIDKRIKENEELLKRFPGNIGLKLNLESLKCFKENAIEELEQRKNDTSN